MPILLLNQFFWPNTGTGQFLGDLADHLTASGETVTVICGSSTYGAAEVDADSEAPRANVVRLNHTGFNRRLRWRVASYVSFLGRALWAGVTAPKPDVVVTMTTPPLLSLIGFAIQTVRGAKHITWEMDIYPDAALDLGVLKPSSVPAAVFGWLADLPRRRAERIIVLGECMKQRLIAHGISPDKIFIADNWSQHLVDRPEPIGHGPLSILYSGNLGMPHDVETIASAAAKCPQNDFEFTFAGGGSRHEWLQKFCAENSIENVFFESYCSRAQLGERLSSAHIGLVTQREATLGSLVPSKTYGVLAASRPLLFIGPKEATPARIIERHNCGWQIDCGDVEGLVQLLTHLDQNRHLIHEAGARAYQAFLTDYQRDIGVARVAAILGVAAVSDRQSIVAAATH